MSKEIKRLQDDSIVEETIMQEPINLQKLKGYERSLVRELQRIRQKLSNARLNIQQYRVLTEEEPKA